ncbi:MAG: hypothetical protein M3Y12_01735 [Bacteroidota bacterium]|nr:hypothetical protein [Bacteroidota bacterium]
MLRTIIADTSCFIIFRIESNDSDICLSTLMRIVREGIDKHLKLSVE